MAGVLEYLAFELLELASNKAGEDNNGKSNAKHIMPRHIMMAVRSDEEFNKFLRGAEFAAAGRMPTSFADSNKKKKKKDVDDEEEDEEFTMESIEEEDSEMHN